jgi:hypothetical protein
VGQVVSKFIKAVPPIANSAFGFVART